MPLCTLCSNPAPFSCSRCHTASYCTPAHQKDHWVTHKDICKALSATPTDKLLTSLRQKYTTLGKPRFWWVMDDTLAVVASSLSQNHYCILDHFLDSASTRTLHKDVLTAWQGGRMSEKGGLTDAREGRNTHYSKDSTRGDFLGWFSGKEGETVWSQDASTAGSTAPEAPPDSLPGYILKVSTLVEELKALLPAELEGVTERSRAMVTCYPPGSRYTKHADNGGVASNGRRLTVLLYLNTDWAPGDGGELAIYDSKDTATTVRIIPPLGGRVVLFWSDKRVPHEVLESNKDRFTVTLWFFHAGELGEYKSKGGGVVE